MNTLQKSYNPAAIEQATYQRWEERGYFTATGNGAPYCIMIPPPNVTGSLHMGHAFQDAVMDALMRYHRMSGRCSLWQAGCDHAGIATQMVVERQLEAQGISRHELGREAFIQKIWQWKKESGDTISRQLRRMGASLDWSRERFTMDEGLSVAVREVFIRLYNDGLIYRGQRLVNWDPVLRTAISDLEVVQEEEAGTLWHIRYPFADGRGYMVVATTRPETMLGDVAVAVHPEDKRYKKRIGTSLQLPLSDGVTTDGTKVEAREIAVIADEYVTAEFGSGCVKVTPAHDFRDYEAGRRHGLAMINVFNDSAAINLPHSPYHGLDRYEARTRIVADLQKQNLIEKIEEHRLMVPRGDRTQAVIEPYLTDQWFVKAAPLAAPAIKAVEEGRIRFVPAQWTRTYYEWMHNIEDWCISRQIWWGHRIPAWYDEDGNVYVAANYDEALAQAKAKAASCVSGAHKNKNKKAKCAITLRQDEDVLDTWFSSALWPFSTLGWPQQTSLLKTFYPTSVLVTGFDIIFFWVARMIMMGLRFLDDIPFHEVYIHGLVRDQDGNKMSKSKGNVLDPLDLISGINLESLVAKRTAGLMHPHMAKRIEQATRETFPNGIAAYGADALRFTFASMATLGRDIRFDLGRVEGYRNFCNKLWNATRYVLMNTEGHATQSDDHSTHQAHVKNIADSEASVAARWIRCRVHQVASVVAEAYRDYRLDIVAQQLYSFAWDDYCSWYLEISKAILNDAQQSAAQKNATRTTLLDVLEKLLRLLHPLIPFVTEELWQQVAPRASVPGDTIMHMPYPTARMQDPDETALSEITRLQQVVHAVRTMRGEMNLEPAAPLHVVVQGLGEGDEKWLARYRLLACSLARLHSIGKADAECSYDDHAVALAGDWKVLTPLAGAINRERELQRLQHAIEKLNTELARSDAKLSNTAFLAKAPAAVVDKVRAQRELMQTNLRDLKERQQQVAALT